jgi:hypothetical protein
VEGKTIQHAAAPRHVVLWPCVCTGDLALLYESWWKTRRSIIWTIAPDRRGEEKQVLFDR